MKKIDKIVEYVESKECKRKFILNYFGEDYDGDCNACSVCNPRLRIIGDGFERSTEPQPELSPATGEEELLEERAKIAFSILELVRTLDFHVGRTFLANILIGSKSKRIFDQNLQESRYYGILKGYTAEEARKIIDQMIAKGYLITKQGSSSYPRPQLYLTELAEKALEERMPIELQLPVKKAEICELGNLSVLEALKEWRKRIAAVNSIPAYCVFHDSTLIGIANRLPKTTQELQTIKGIGKRKIENYGNEILKLVDEVE